MWTSGDSSSRRVPRVSCAASSCKTNALISISFWNARQTKYNWFIVKSAFGWKVTLEKLDAFASCKHPEGALIFEPLVSTFVRKIMRATPPIVTEGTTDPSLWDYRGHLVWKSEIPSSARRGVCQSVESLCRLDYKASMGDSYRVCLEKAGRCSARKCLVMNQVDPVRLCSVTVNAEMFCSR